MLQAVPFLLLAVGVDNLFIMARCHDRLLALDADPRPSAKRLGAVLAQTGPSMLLSTLAEEGCFLIGKTRKESLHKRHTNTLGILNPQTYGFDCLFCTC